MATKLSARVVTASEPYHDLSPTPGAPLERGRPSPDWFGSAAGEGYTQELLARFEERNPTAAAELRYIANEAKWSSGWRDLGRMIEEVLA